MFGIEMFDPWGPYPYDYDLGIHSALGMLWKNEQSGRHEEKQKYLVVHKV